MRYRLIAIGQLKRGFYAEGCAFYAKRLAAYAKLELRELKASAPEQESAALLAAASGHLVCLDERGEMLSSQELAARLSALELSGISQLSLLIGGAEGLSATVRQRADDCWSLSRLTLPHELARLVLLEQLYRAETIRAGHPYHRE